MLHFTASSLNYLINAEMWTDSSSTKFITLILVYIFFKFQKKYLLSANGYDQNDTLKDVRNIIPPFILILIVTEWLLYQSVTLPTFSKSICIQIQHC